MLLYNQYSEMRQVQDGQQALKGAQRLNEVRRGFFKTLVIISKLITDLKCIKKNSKAFNIFFISKKFISVHAPHPEKEKIIKGTEETYLMAMA